MGLEDLEKIVGLKAMPHDKDIVNDLIVDNGF